MAGTFEFEGLTFPSAGDTPTQDELRAAADLVKSKKATQQPMPDLSAAIGASASATRPLEDAPTAGHIVLPGVNPFGKKDIEGNDALSIASKLALQYGPLSTDNPKARQEIYVKHLPGATAAEDRFGRPMIEYKGKRYYMSREGELDLMDAGRLTAAIAGTVPLIAFAPATVPGLLAAGAVTAAGQSVAEDLVAKASGGESLPWVDVEKALWSGAFGAMFPAILKGGTVVAGRLNELIKRGEPLTDAALKDAGLTPAQIASITPEIRDKVTTIARRTFGDPKAVGATYRTELADEFAPGGGLLTKGEISGDPAQIAREQTLSQASDVPGRAPAANIMQANRAAQDVQLNQAQQQLRVKAGGRPGGVPMTAEEASAAIKSGFGTAFELTDAAVDRAYAHARNPAAVVEAGGSATVPPAHASQLAPTTRTALENSNTGRIVLGDSAPNLTPNAKEALAAVDRFSQRSAGPQAKDVSWQTTEDLRQELIGYEKAAAKAGGGQDLAVVKQIIKNFDEHFGSLNPLYKPARSAHEEMMTTFVSGAGRDQDAATKQVLKVLEGPEGGSAVTNVILGGHVNKNTAGQMIDHLKDRVFPDQPQMQNVLKEQFLRRLTEDAKGNALTPQATATMIDTAFGDQQGSLYAKLFTADELKELRRFQELMKTLGESRNKINPPGSGLIVSAVLKAGTAANIGAGVGTGIGGGIGHLLEPIIPGATGLGGAGGLLVGREVGKAIDALRMPRQAAAAVSPPPEYLPRTPTPGLLSGQAAVGPADRLMEDLLR
jgi:hypothetical protein